MITLLFMLTVLMPQEHLGFPQPEFIVECYPETVMPGDTLYVTLVVKNPFDKSIHISRQYSVAGREVSVQFHLKDSESRLSLRSDHMLTYIGRWLSRRRILREIYQTIREYDIADKPQWSLGRLQTLGLMDIAL